MQISQYWADKQAQIQSEPPSSDEIEAGIEMFSGFGLMNTVFQISTQLGKMPDEIISMDTSTFCALMIWNSAKSTYQSNLNKLNK
mgnify:FL=1